MNNTVLETMAQSDGDGKPRRLPRGAYTKIARRVRPQVTAQHVREVYLGRRPSARISAAIERFLREQAAA